MENLKYLMALNCVVGLGAAKIRHLLNYFGSAQEVFKADKKGLLSAGHIGETEAQNIRDADINKIFQEQSEIALKKNAFLIPFDHEDYPSELKKLHTPPIFLYCRGKIKPPPKSPVAVVGTRKITPYGREITALLAADLAKHGFTIISGMARGVDSVAHIAALKAQGQTIAVLGCGLDVVYPAENGGLMEEIVNNGAVITEYPFKTPPEPSNFPRRNRIIAALSTAVLITEAGEKSGALLTAQYAMQQKKRLFVVPANVNSQTSAGSNSLLRKGARAVTNVQDMLNDLNLTPACRNMPAPPEIDNKEAEIYNVLSFNPKHIDQISSSCRLSVPEALSMLLSLEIKGLVQQLGGKNFIKTLNSSVV